jgi:trehalose 6-phosphate synthase
VFVVVLIVVSNREPYLHERTEDGHIAAHPTTGGVAVALDALMRERGGTWIAHGAGSADREVVDEHDCVMVPPERPSYRLRRIWLTEEEERRYYLGFANEGLWPLCHLTPVDPVFRPEDWTEYQAVNRRFADAIRSELTEPLQPVFIQDYHLALVAGYVRESTPRARTALFWHIPWPPLDRLRLCPWWREIVEGLLANDFLAFQVERDRRNFIAAARECAAAAIDRATVLHRGRFTHVAAVPIGVDFDRISAIASDPSLRGEMDRLRQQLRLSTPIVGVGVDRLDYTKGIPERLDAIERVLESDPDLSDRITFVQIGVPSRSKLESYKDIERQIDAKVAALNERFGRGPADGPIRYRKSSMKLGRLVALYKLADFCVVSSLHDGMNLVAKEFVAARDDEQGVLVLSELTGAAQELKDALIISPYDVEGFARAIRLAIAMPPEEQASRMASLRRIVAGRDVFAWASDILGNLESVATRHLAYRRLHGRGVHSGRAGVPKDRAAEDGSTRES